MPFYQHSKDIELFYQQFGSGKKFMIAFHGFSRSSNDFDLYAPFLSDYTIIAPDLFYHGQTHFKGKSIKSFDKIQLKYFFEAWIQHLNLDCFDVLGYSMGGRLALFFVEQFPTRIKALHLLAPDGLKTNFWNWWVSNTQSGKYVYGYTITHPQWVYKVAKVGKKLQVLPQKMDKFIDINFGTQGIRLRIYRVWQLYKHIYFSKRKLAAIIISHQIPCKLVIGKKDPVIPANVVHKFYQLIKNHASILTLNAGHDLFKNYLLKELCAFIQDNEKQNS